MIGRPHEEERKRYAKLLHEADRRVECNTLAALSVFVVWGRRPSNPAARMLRANGSDHARAAADS